MPPSVTHGVDAYLAGLPGVSARAIRQGADTVYFWSFRDLTDGPGTLQATP